MNRGGLGVILQDLTKLADCGPGYCCRCPGKHHRPTLWKRSDPGNNLVSVFKQKEKDFERDALQLQRTTSTAQPPGMQIKLKAFAEPDRCSAPDVRKPWHTP